LSTLFPDERGSAFTILVTEELSDMLKVSRAEFAKILRRAAAPLLPQDMLVAQSLSAASELLDEKQREVAMLQIVERNKQILERRLSLSSSSSSSSPNHSASISTSVSICTEINEAIKQLLLLNQCHDLIERAFECPEGLSHTALDVLCERSFDVLQSASKNNIPAVELAFLVDPIRKISMAFASSIGIPEIFSSVSSSSLTHFDLRLFFDRNIRKTHPVFCLVAGQSRLFVMLQRKPIQARAVIHWMRQLETFYRLTDCVDSGDWDRYLEYVFGLKMTPSLKTLLQENFLPSTPSSSSSSSSSSAPSSTEGGPNSSSGPIVID